ncbi:hypothetical protein [Nocardioides zhouii]|uniref:Uncharacterized protein n=1 Tax=Nocardioides zhouii TaxID=1168729 RepID=A0A4V1RN77_9ACTN|nr:hypothetical protein [Nocardioides zhouii]RYC04897.1 hypothetical protein EUA94_20240 [Nocardioides zhouii]
MSTEQPHQLEQSAPSQVTRSRTPEQATAWAKVDRERAEAAGRGGATTVHPMEVVRLAIGVLLAAAALTTFFVMAPDEPSEETRASRDTPVEYLALISVQQQQADDRRDALLLIGLVGLGAAIATSGAERRTVGRPR